MSRPLGPDPTSYAAISNETSRSRRSCFARNRAAAPVEPDVGPFLHGAARYPATSAEVQHPVAPKKATPRGCDRFRGFEPRRHRGRRRASAGAQSELGRHASGPAGQVGRASDGQARLRGAQLRVAGPNASLANARSIIAGSDSAGIAAPIGGQRGNRRTYWRHSPEPVRPAARTLDLLHGKQTLSAPSFRFIPAYRSHRRLRRTGDRRRFRRFSLEFWHRIGTETR